VDCYSECLFTYQMPFSRQCKNSEKKLACKENKMLTTNLENLECLGISLNVENSGNSVQPQGKIVTNKVFLVRH